MDTGGKLDSPKSWNCKTLGQYISIGLYCQKNEMIQSFKLPTINQGGQLWEPNPLNNVQKWATIYQDNFLYLRGSFPGTSLTIDNCQYVICQSNIVLATLSYL